MSDRQIDRLLTGDEELLFEFDGKLEDNKFNQSEFVATDQRILWTDGTGGFGDIDYDHVVSVSSDSTQEWKPWDK